MAKRRTASRGEYVAHLVNSLVALVAPPEILMPTPTADDKRAYKSLLAEIARVVDGGEPPADAPLMPKDWKADAAYAE